MIDCGLDATVYEFYSMTGMHSRNPGEDIISYQYTQQKRWQEGLKNSEIQKQFGVA